MTRDISACDLPTGEEQGGSADWKDANQIG